MCCSCRIRTTTSNSPVFLNNLAKIDDFIANGGTMVFHDRHVTTAASILPGLPGTIVREISSVAGSDINIVDDTTLVTHGPAGIVDNTSLDRGTLSSHGFIDATHHSGGGARDPEPAQSQSAGVVFVQVRPRYRLLLDDSTRPLPRAQRGPEPECEHGDLRSKRRGLRQRPALR